MQLCSTQKTNNKCKESIAIIIRRKIHEQTTRILEHHVFTDKSKFKIFVKKKMQQKKYEIRKIRKILLISLSMAKVILWFEIAVSGIEKLTFINNTMNRFQYLDILRTNLAASITVQFSDLWIFYQDRDFKHTKIVNWLQQNASNQLNFPSIPRF